MGVIIEFEKLDTTDPNHARFFALLKQKRQMIYDWDNDQLTVVGDGQTITITAQEFKQITQLKAFSQADLVLLIVINVISVEVINTGKSFKSPKEQQMFFDDLKRQAQQFPA